MEQALKYAQGVLDGSIPACIYVRQAAQRFFEDLEKYDYREGEALKALRFIQAQKHTKGEWKGENLILEPWQVFIVANLFGIYREDGRRKYTRAYLEMPKKQGKSPLAAAIGNYFLVDPTDGSPEVYSAATKLDQAAIVWQYAADMFGGLCSEYELESNIANSFNNRRIVYNGGIFKPVAYDERDKNDGLSVSCAIIDEYHAHPSDRIYNVLADGMAARKSPLLLAITTAGHDRDSACYKHREHCVKVLAGQLKDEDLFALIYTIDEGDEWDSEATWKKANPNYGVSVKPDYIKSKIAEARESGGKKDSFLIKHLNFWTDSYTTWLSSTDVAACNTGFQPEEGATCYAGLDLGSTSDLSVLALNFADGDRHRVIYRYYTTEKKAREYQGQIGDNIRQWIRDGYIQITGNKLSDYTYIENDMLELSKRYNIFSVGYDPWNASQFVARMTEHGFNMREFSQAITSISEPTKHLEKIILDRLFEYDGNPVTTWMFGNAEIYMDANLNMKVIKGKDINKKVDGVIATIMAVGEAIDEDNKEAEWFFTPQSL